MAIANNKETKVKNISERVRMARHFKKEGIPKTEIARILGVHRTTVHRLLNNNLGANRKYKSKLDPYKDYIRSRLEDYNIVAPEMLKEIQKLGYSGRVTILRDFMSTVKSKNIQKIVDRFETNPGFIQ